MSDCESCRLNGRKCSLAFLLAKLVVLTLYGSVLSVLSGVIFWFSMSTGLSEDTAVLLVVVFFGIELVLFLAGGIHAPGLLLTAILFGPLILWLKQQASFKPVTENGRQIIKKLLLTRNTTA